MSGELRPFEAERSRAELVTTFRSIADAFDEDNSVSVAFDDQSTIVRLPETFSVELEIERAPIDEEGGAHEIELEIELEWTEPTTEHDRKKPQLTSNRVRENSAVRVHFNSSKTAQTSGAGGSFTGTGILSRPAAKGIRRSKTPERESGACSGTHPKRRWPNDSTRHHRERWDTRAHRSVVSRLATRARPAESLWCMTLHNIV